MCQLLRKLFGEPICRVCHWCVLHLVDGDVSASLPGQHERYTQWVLVCNRVCIEYAIRNGSYNP